MLQNAPMYSYIPAKDVSRARKFYEDKLGFKPGPEAGGGVSYQFANGKPLQLIDGTALLSLCHQHNIPARIIRRAS